MINGNNTFYGICVRINRDRIVQFSLADRTNGRAYAAGLRPSLCHLWRMYCG